MKINSKRKFAKKALFASAIFCAIFVSRPKAAIAQETNGAQGCTMQTIRAALLIPACTGGCELRTTCPSTRRSGASACAYYQDVQNTGVTPLDTCHFEYKWSQHTGTGCTPATCYSGAIWRYEYTPDSTVCPPGGGAWAGIQ